VLQVQTRGSFKNMEAFAKRVASRSQFKVLHKYGQAGVAALSTATPKDKAETAGSWDYEIVEKSGYFAIHWSNSHVNDGVPIAVLIQYGHATRNGGRVEGRDYINPALRPIFDQMAADMWREVTK